MYHTQHQQQQCCCEHLKKTSLRYIAINANTAGAGRLLCILFLMSFVLSNIVKLYILSQIEQYEKMHLKVSVEVCCSVNKRPPLFHIKHIKRTCHTPNKSMNEHFSFIKYISLNKRLHTDKHHPLAQTNLYDSFNSVADEQWLIATLRVALFC